MKTLSDIQACFYRLSQEPDSEANAYEWISPHPLLSAAEQIAIYRDSYIGRLQNVLAQVYPVTLRLLGKDCFMQMARAYIEREVSASANLDEYGESFPDLMKIYPAIVDLSYMPDLGRLEWAWHRLNWAECMTPFNFSKLEGLGHSPHFLLPSESSLIESRFPLDQIWLQNQTENLSEEPIHLKIQNYYFLVWRSEDTKRVDSISASAFQILKLIQAQKSLDDICESLDETLQLLIPKLLPELIQKAWIADFY